MFPSNSSHKFSDRKQGLERSALGLFLRKLIQIFGSKQATHCMLIFVYEMRTTRPDSYVCHETGLNAMSTSGHASKAHSAVSDLPQPLQKKSQPPAQMLQGYGPFSVFPKRFTCGVSS